MSQNDPGLPSEWTKVDKVTGREPGLSRLHQQRFEEMTLVEMISLMDETTARLFACDCVERQLLRINNPDPRSVEAIRVSRLFANSKTTGKELGIARDEVSNVEWENRLDNTLPTRLKQVTARLAWEVSCTYTNLREIAFSCQWYVGWRTIWLAEFAGREVNQDERIKEEKLERDWQKTCAIEYLTGQIDSSNRLELSRKE